MAKQSFYGVSVGRQPGVYRTWDECKAQVDGYPGSKYKKFGTEAEAQQFVSGVPEKVQVVVPNVSAAQSAEPAVKTSGSGKATFYAVSVGRQPGVYQTWDECKAQVDGYPGSKYKKFTDEMEAQNFVLGRSVPKQPDVTSETPNLIERLQQPVSSQSKDDSLIPDGPYAFVDGSFNAQTGVYGYGGFLSVKGVKIPVMGSGRDPEMASMRNVAGEIEGSMAAVKLAEQMNIRNLTILYDYRGIECWAIPAGQKDHWKTTKQGTKDYAEFIQSPDRKTEIKFQKVAAHTGIEGNEMADVMAKTAVGIGLTPAQTRYLRRALADEEAARNMFPAAQEAFDKVKVYVPSVGDELGLPDMTKGNEEDVSFSL